MGVAATCNGLGLELCLCLGHRLGYWCLLSGSFIDGVGVALIPSILPTLYGTDTTAEPQRCEPWAAGISTEALGMDGSPCPGTAKKLGVHWGDQRLCVVDMALGESHKPSTESFSGNSSPFPLVPGFPSSSSF